MVFTVNWGLKSDFWSKNFGPNWQHNKSLSHKPNVLKLRTKLWVNILYMIMNINWVQAPTVATRYHNSEPCLSYFQAWILRKDNPCGSSVWQKRESLFRWHPFHRSTNHLLQFSDYIWKYLLKKMIAMEFKTGRLSILVYFLTCLLITPINVPAHNVSCFFFLIIPVHFCQSFPLHLQNIVFILFSFLYAFNPIPSLHFQLSLPSLLLS